MAATAALLDVSEFEVFRRAHLHWYGRAGQQDVLEAAFQGYLSSAATPMWVRDFTRKTIAAAVVGQPVLRPATPRLPSRPLSVLLGVLILLLLAACVAGLIRLAVLAQQANALQCTLPPCF